VYLARSFAASSGSVVIVDTVGAGSAGGKGSAGDAATAGGAAGRATTAGKGFEWLGGVLCDPHLNIFLRRLRNPFPGLFGSLRRALVSHTDEEKRQEEPPVNPEPESPIYRTAMSATMSPYGRTTSRQTIIRTIYALLAL